MKLIITIVFSLCFCLQAAANITGPTSGCPGDYSYSGIGLFSEHEWSVQGGQIVSGHYSLNATVKWYAGTGTRRLTYQGYSPFNGQTYTYVLDFSVTSFSAGSVSGASVCRDASGSVTLTGHTGSVINWQKRDYHPIMGWSSWSNISSTASSLAYSGIQLTTQYKAYVSTTCGNQWSSTGQVTVNLPPNPGTLSAPISEYCGSGGGSITALNYTGSIIRWEKSTNGGSTWTNINNTTHILSYSIATTTKYRVVVDNSWCSPVASSNPKEITIYNAEGGTTSGDQSICEGGSGTLSLSGYNGSIQKWQKKHEFGAWYDISGTAGQTAYNFSTLWSDTEYRAVVQNGPCSNAYSTVSKVTVYDPPTPGTLTADQNTFCGSGAVTLTLSGQSDGLTEWQKSTNGGSSWQTLSNPGPGDPVSSVLLVSTPTLFRVRSQGAAPCSNAISNTVSISVDQISRGELLAGMDVYNQTGEFEPVLNNYSGTISTWEKSTNGGSTWSAFSAGDIIDNANMAAPTLRTFAPIHVRARVTSGVCSPETSPEMFVNFRPKVAAGWIDGPDLLHDDVNGNNQATLELKEYDGSVTAWYQSTDYGATWQELSSSASHWYTLENITEDRLLKARITLPNLGEHFSQIKQVAYQPYEDNELTNHFVKTTTVITDGVLDINGFTNLPDSLSIDSYAHHDGLGRPVQQVVKGASPTGQDIISFREYDSAGRSADGYLPYTGTGHNFYTNAKTDQATFYATRYPGETPHTTNSFELSPIGRVLERGAPGNDWQVGSGHTVAYNYEFNAANTVRKWSTTGVSTGYYAAGTLAKTSMTDENGNDVISYTNSLGRTVLKEVEAGPGVFLKTYTIYDRYGRPVYILPPKATETLGTSGTLEANHASVAELVFANTYDHRGRLVERKVPGKTVDYIVYDQLDRPLLIQDGNLRANNQWYFSKFDVYQRPVYSGIYTNVMQTTRTQVQALLDALDYNAADVWYEERSTSGTYKGYTNHSFPSAGIELINVTYYDDYDFDRDGITDVDYDANALAGLPAANFDRVNGVATGSSIRVLGTDQWLQSVHFFDAYGRVIQRLSDNHAQGTDVSSMVYSFDGQVRNVKSEHLDFKTITDLEYDHAGRVNKIGHQMGEPVVWTSINNLAMVDERLKKTSGGAAWNGAAYADQLIPAGEDGILEIVIEATNKRRMIGLNDNNTGHSWNEINYAFYFLHTATVQIREGGGAIGSRSYAIGDRFRIERKGDSIYYWHNDFLMRQRPAISSSLEADVSIYDPNHILENMYLYQEEVEVTAYTYNELGQLATKNLHLSPADGGAGGGSFLQTLNYTYNIRGWLKSVNDPDNMTTDQLFGMELFYNDNPGGSIAHTKTYNGNISALEWKNNLTSGSEKQAYTYTYDATDRLTQANYGEGSNFTLSPQHYALSSISYDANGNIQNLTRKAPDATGTAVNMDNLTYGYTANRITSVNDSANDTEGFIDNGSGTEYTYNANGNMTSDENKDITLISYNVLNKCDSVVFGNGTAIGYLYNGMGIKLAEKVYHNGILVNRTDYRAGAVYENDTLQFLPHPEGRITYSPTQGGAGGGWDYQYNLTDHLGNTRMLLSSQPEHISFTATFESEGVNQKDDALFQNLSNTVDLQATSYDEVQRLLPGTVGGAALTVPVYPGDTVSLSVQGFYRNGSGSSTVSVTSLVAAVAGAFGGLNGGNPTEQSTFDAFEQAINPALGGAGINNPGSDVAAYLNYIIFDKNMAARQEGYLPLPSEANAVATLMSLSNVVSPVEGFVYVYLTNESNAEVYFDDFEVTVKESLVVQNTSYYPFGLQHNSSWTRPTELKNNFLYNAGSELNEKTQNYETYYRPYDPALGRFTGIDPYAAAFSNQTPYNFAFNDPVALNDPLGDYPRHRNSVIDDIRQNTTVPWDPDYICATCDGGGGLVGNLGSGMSYGYGYSGAAYEQYQLNLAAHRARYQAENGDSRALNAYVAQHGQYDPEFIANALNVWENHLGVDADGNLIHYQEHSTSLYSNAGTVWGAKYVIPQVLNVQQSGGTDPPCPTCGWNFFVGVEGDVSAGVQGGFNLAQFVGININVASVILAEGKINNLEGASGRRIKSGDIHVKQGISASYLAGLGYTHSFDVINGRPKNESHEIKFGVTFLGGTLKFDENWNLQNAFVGFDGFVGGAFLFGLNGALKIGGNYKPGN